MNAIETKPTPGPWGGVEIWAGTKFRARLLGTPEWEEASCLAKPPAGEADPSLMEAMREFCEGREWDPILRGWLFPSGTPEEIAPGLGKALLEAMERRGAVCHSSETTK